MALERFGNLARSQVVSGLANTTDPVTFTILDPSMFPTSGNFRLKVGNEILLVTAVSGDQFTVSRAQEGTTAASHPNGVTATAILSAGSLIQGIRDRAPYLYNAVTDFGAVGDNSTDNTDALRAMLAAGGAGPYYLPPGIYLTDQLSWDVPSLRLFGAGRKSVLKAKAGATSPLLKQGGLRNEISDLRLNLVLAPTLTAIQIGVNSRGDYALLRDLQFHDGAIGLDVVTAEFFYGERLFGGDASGDNPQTTAGIRINGDQSGETSFTDCFFRCLSGGTDGFLITRTTTDDTGGHRLNNCWFTGGGFVNGIRLEKTGGGSPAPVFLIANNSGADASSAYAWKLVNVSYVFATNPWGVSPGKGLHIDGGNAFRFHGGLIEDTELVNAPTGVVLVGSSSSLDLTTVPDGTFAATSDAARLFVIVESGKHKLYALFPTGAKQLIASEP